MLKRCQVSDLVPAITSGKTEREGKGC